MLGGDPQKLIFDVDSGVSFSPDGKRMAFMRHAEKNKENNLVIANEDGSNEQIILTRKFPNYDRYFAWSPDGRVIAYEMDNKDEKGYYANIEAINLADRTTRTISSARWKWINSVVWMPDANGLITCVTTDVRSGEVLMVAHMNAQALQRTITSGDAWYYSRSRKKLWRKGESSGHGQRVIEMRVDCDQDAVWIKVEQTGPGACHTGRRSCFYRAVKLGSAEGSSHGDALTLEFRDGEKAFDPQAVYSKEAKPRG